jgi:mannose-6-phosphate isomerase-like protein (cupin superfamily)
MLKTKQTNLTLSNNFFIGAEMSQNIRRVVTGHDENGKSICISDSDANNVLKRDSRPGVTLTNFWECTSTPAEFDGAEETVDGPFILHPPKGGSVFRMVEFEPEDPEILKTLDGKDAFGAMGASDAIVEDARHPFMHRTNSVDYAVIVSGEITMLLDDSSVHLKAGDVVVQRGTNHAWSNQGTKSCIVAFVLVDALATV